MPRMCAVCLRNMYTLDTWAEATDWFEKYPLGGLTRDGEQAFRERWAWQSDWNPALCRECDTDHDHRDAPGLWFKLKRWWRNL